MSKTHGYESYSLIKFILTPENPKESFGLRPTKSASSDDVGVQSCKTYFTGTPTVCDRIMTWFDFNPISGASLSLGTKPRMTHPRFAEAQ